MKKFKPVKTSHNSSLYKSLFLEGYKIKRDFGGTSYMEVWERDACISDSNVGQGETSGRLKVLTPIDDDAWDEALKQLKDEGFSMKKERCYGSGCCQYSAYIFYLLGSY